MESVELPFLTDIDNKLHQQAADLALKFPLWLNQRGGCFFIDTGGTKIKPIKLAEAMKSEAITPLGTTKPELIHIIPADEIAQKSIRAFNETKQTGQQLIIIPGYKDKGYSPDKERRFQAAVRVFQQKYPNAWMIILTDELPGKNKFTSDKPWYSMDFSKDYHFWQLSGEVNNISISSFLRKDSGLYEKQRQFELELDELPFEYPPEDQGSILLSEPLPEPNQVYDDTLRVQTALPILDEKTFRINGFTLQLLPIAVEVRAEKKLGSTGEKDGLINKHEYYWSLYPHKGNKFREDGTLFNGTLVNGSSLVPAEAFKETIATIIKSFHPHILKNGVLPQVGVCYCDKGINLFYSVEAFSSICNRYFPAKIFEAIQVALKKEGEIFSGLRFSNVPDRSLRMIYEEDQPKIQRVKKELQENKIDITGLSEQQLTLEIERLCNEGTDKSGKEADTLFQYLHWHGIEIQLRDTVNHFLKASGGTQIDAVSGVNEDQWLQIEKTKARWEALTMLEHLTFFFPYFAFKIPNKNISDIYANEIDRKIGAAMQATYATYPDGNVKEMLRAAVKVLEHSYAPHYQEPQENIKTSDRVYYQALISELKRIVENLVKEDMCLFQKSHH